MSITQENHDNTQPLPLEPVDKTNLKTNNAERFNLAEQLNFRFRWIILLALVLAAIMEILDTTIVNVALAQMAGNLGATTQEIAWVSTSYILANVVVLPMTAFFTERFGRRNYLTASIIIFTIASFLCGTSHSLGEIILWRMLQGAGGAALISSAQAALVRVFPKSEQAIVQPLFLMGIVVAPTLGPTLGGFITDALSWNWCFWINIPFGILAATLVFTLMRDTEAAKPDVPIDYIGIALLTAGLGGIQYVLEDGQQNDWFNDPDIVRIAILAGLALGGLVWWLLSPKNKHPVLDLRVLKNRQLTTGIILFLAIGFSLYGVNYLYPLLAQQIQGLTPTQSGMSLLPNGLASAVSIVFCGVITSNPKSKIDPRMLIVIGIVLSTTSLWMLGNLSIDSGRPDTFLPLLLRGLSMGFQFIPVNSVSINALGPNETQEGISLLGLARQLGGSLGTALLATYYAGEDNKVRGNLIGYVNNQSAAFNSTASQMSGALHAHGYTTAQSISGALGMIAQTVQRQAAMITYDHSFLFVMLIGFSMMPLVLLMQRPKQGAPTAAMH